MKIQGSELLPFDEAQKASPSDANSDFIINGISAPMWDFLCEKGFNATPTLDPMRVKAEIDGFVGSFTIPLRALKSSAIQRLGLDRWPEGVAA